MKKSDVASHFIQFCALISVIALSAFTIILVCVK